LAVRHLTSFMIKAKEKRRVGGFDWQFFFLTLILTFLGLVFIADVSAPQALNFFGDRFYFVKQQAVWAALGIFLLCVTSKLNYRFWSKVAVPLFFISLLFLILVLIPQFGYKTLGARRWLVFGPVVFQPAELVKFTLAVYFAKLAEEKKSFLAYLIPLVVVLALVMFQPDFGTSLIIGAIGILQLFISGVNIFYFLGIAVVSLIAAVVLIFISPYRRDRLISFLGETGDPLGKSYHISQVLISLGLGGWFGAGLGASKQKYLFLPEAATDSIFAVIAEEIGFFGSMVLILVLFYFFYRGFKISISTDDSFAKVLSFGLIVWFAGQSFLNLASMVALTPMTGVPLPFFSYGGSSLTMILVAVGIMLNISSTTADKARARALPVKSAIFKRNGKPWHLSGSNLVSIKTKKQKVGLKGKRN